MTIDDVRRWARDDGRAMIESDDAIVICAHNGCPSLVARGDGREMTACAWAAWMMSMRGIDDE